MRTVFALLLLTIVSSSCRKLNKKFKPSAPRHFDTVSVDYVSDAEHAISMDMHPGVSIQTFKSDTSVYHRVANRHIFSSAEDLDVFELILRGPNTLKANLYFTIMNAAGDTLYYDKGDAYHFVDYAHSAPIEDQEKIIYQKMDEFFDLNRFTTPAIRKNESFDKRYHKDKELFLELQNDPNSRGFSYEGLDGKHSVRVAWSGNYRQVNVYYNF